MGAHPAHCDCGDTDQRVTQCPHCDRDIIVGQHCPHCWVRRSELEAAEAIIDELRAALRKLTKAFEALHPQGSH